MKDRRDAVHQAHGSKAPESARLKFGVRKVRDPWRAAGLSLRICHTQSASAANAELHKRGCHVHISSGARVLMAPREERGYL